MHDIIRNKIKGYLKIETIKDGEIINSWEEHNLIMDLARESMADAISSVGNNTKINKLVIGVDSNSVEYDPSSTALISESGVEGTNYYVVDWQYTTITNNVQANILTAGLTPTGDTILISQIGQEVTYTIEIGQDNANGAGTLSFDEAALYAGDKIFSTRFFTEQNKDNQVVLRIIWKITF